MNIKKVVGLIVALLTVFSACNEKPAVRNVEPREAYGMLRNDFAVLVDVREADEISGGMAEGAQWMPFTSRIEQNPAEFDTWAASLPKEKTIIVYCRTGRRSGLVAERLAAKGLKAANMGGFDAWKAAGLPVKSGGEQK